MTELPPPLAGAWEVERVAVDTVDQPHWNYRPDDPELMGRELIVDSEHAQFHAGKEPNCKPAFWQRHTTTWGDLIASSQIPSSATGVDRDPIPADYGLKVSRKGAVTVYSFCGGPSAPKHSSSNAYDWMRAPWLVAQATDRVLMRLDDQTLVVLVRRKPHAKPQPSFPCAKAFSPSEKAICASFTLASWDRSVALAWRRALESGASGSLMPAQKEWLRERDACGADAHCLQEKMAQRTRDLRAF